MSGNNSWQGGDSDEQPTQFQDFSQQGQQPSPGNNGGSMPQWGNQPQGQGSQGGEPYGQPNQGQYGQQQQGQFGAQQGNNNGPSPQQFGNPGQQQYGGQPPYGQQQYGQQSQPDHGPFGAPQGQYGSQPGQPQFGAPANQYAAPSNGSQVSLQQRMKKSDGSLNIAFVSGIALAVAALFIIIGSFGTWASAELHYLGESATIKVSGLGQVSGDGGSSHTDDTKDGVFTLIFGIGLIVMAALYLFGKLQKKIMWGAVALSVIITGIALYDMVDLKDKAGDLPKEFDASISTGWGLWLVLLFGLVALGTSVYTALRDE